MPKGTIQTAIERCDMYRTSLIEALKIAIDDGDANVPNDIQEMIATLEAMEKEKDIIIRDFINSSEFGK
jgi:hypothetical protein